jgi:hypothetical protein
MTQIFKTVAFLLLLMCKPSFTMHHLVTQYLFYSTVIGGSTYGVCKAISEYEKRTFKNVPKNIEEWARKKLTKIGLKNVDSIPLKVNNDSFMPGSFIALDDTYLDRLEDHKKEILTTKSLFHRAEIYQNNDLGKFCLFCGMSMAIPFLQLSNIPVLLCTSTLCMGANVVYKRYQEKEADKFAYMNMSPEDLRILKEEKKYHAQIFEYNLLHDPLCGDRNWLERHIRPLLSYKLNSLNSEQVQQKKHLITLAEFVAHPKKPSHEQQIVMIQECLDKKKNENIF